MSDYIFSLDIGTRTVIGTVGIVKDKKFHVVKEYMVEHEERAMVDGQIHDIGLVAEAVKNVKKNLEKSLRSTLDKVAIAAAGRFLKTVEVNCEISIDVDKAIDKELVRSLELSAVKKAEDEVHKSTEGRLYCVGYSVKNYYLNGFIISNLQGHKGDAIGAMIIATFLPRSVVDSLYGVMKEVDLTVSSLTLEPIAAIEAAIPKNLRLLNIALVDIGAGTSDIAICSNESISAFGMVSVAGDEVTEIIAKEYLVDFNTAEKIKRDINIKEEIVYTDILGLEGVIKKEDILKVVKPTIDKLVEEISSKIIELNGGKAPNAIFLVGGGAHTPTLKDVLAEKLNLPAQRIAIKDRSSVVDCVCKDNNMGSTGVTVLGIALDAVKKSGNNFIDVIINENVVSLFNYHDHTVMDVIVAAGINPRLLIGKNGKNIKFSLNGDNRVAFGTIAKNAAIKVNGKTASIDSEVIEGDSIKVEFANDGVNAKPKIYEYLKSVGNTTFYYNDEIVYLEPIAYKNAERVSIDEFIDDGDAIDVIYPTTFGDYLLYYLNVDHDIYKYYLNDYPITKDYVIKEGDKIYSEINDDTDELVAADTEKNNLVHNDNKDEVIIKKEIKVKINDTFVNLTGRENYKFVDIFDFYPFDLTEKKGNLTMLLNGKSAGFYDELHENDEILIYFK
ncbi:MAG: cell division protein FtsA [Clostridiaceae bacterium]